MSFPLDIAAGLTGIRAVTTETTALSSITAAPRQRNRQTVISYPLRGSFQYVLHRSHSPQRYRSGKVVSVGPETAGW